MPLSEHEQRLLDEIERALYAEDPKFAASVRQNDLRTHLKRRVRRATVLFALGMGGLVVGAATRLMWVGVAGFLVMLAAGLILGRTVQRLGRGENANAAAAGTAPARPRKPKRRRGDKSGGGLFDRIQERWQRRWEDRGDD